ncbi:alpha/beta fold hydrolase [Phytomonospora endophytica]|uniref:Pimeloyl-ACP methyl ester carboxylesterase n=1 Tax=Phytomonospora endophytica TaxID=714109 RepID=A0A841G2L7_9ACTN|nr:alpha/beta hydrolase [Phytomonospora endophytica]MBB6038380.1 pimeloyl-ACP methyl ester carboxylesterase [Phytomonospora endophytica]GIG64311.1 alpha/beta hydrolase [Phytomonospora endophytica]
MATVEVGNAQVRYEIAGEGPALMLVHGTGSAGAALTWGQLVPMFAGRTVITPDLSGSDATSDDGAPLTLDVLAEQVVAVIEAAGCGPVDLLGFSLGSPVVATVAARRPDLVRRLVLVAGWTRTEGDVHLSATFDLWRRLGVNDPVAFGRFVALTGFSRGFLDGLGDEGFAGIAGNMPPTPNTLRQVDLNARVDVRDVLSHVTAPTLVIGGTRDATVPVEHSRALHTAIAGSSYAELDAGHVMFFERAKEFVDVVVAHLDA